MNEKVKKFYDYLNRQVELHKQWINEALAQDKNITSLNNKLEFIKTTRSVFENNFIDYIDILPELSDEELPGFED